MGDGAQWGPDSLQIDVRTLQFISRPRSLAASFTRTFPKLEVNMMGTLRVWTITPKLDMVSSPTLILNGTDNVGAGHLRCSLFPRR